jgi:hypothetical protein
MREKIRTQNSIGRVLNQAPLLSMFLLHYFIHFPLPPMIYGHGLIKALSLNLSGGTKENHTTLSHDSWCPKRNLNRALSKYKTEVLPIWSLCCVFCFKTVVPVTCVSSTVHNKIRHLSLRAEMDDT